VFQALGILYQEYLHAKCYYWLCSRGLIFELFFCQQFSGLIFEGAYTLDFTVCHCGLHLTYVGNFWATKSTFFVMKTIKKIFTVTIEIIFVFRKIPKTGTNGVNKKNVYLMIN
jgi:hypothetical protein